jgi:hypothetical protein
MHVLIVDRIIDQEHRGASSTTEKADVRIEETRALTQQRN